MKFTFSIWEYNPKFKFVNKNLQKKQVSEAAPMNGEKKSKGLFRDFNYPWTGFTAAGSRLKPLAQNGNLI